MSNPLGNASKGTPTLAFVGAASAGRLLKPILVAWVALGMGCGGGSTQSHHVPPPAPSITAFSAEKELVTVDSATKLTATFLNGLGTIDKGVGAVSSGVPISTGPLSAETVFTLTVSGEGGSIFRTLTVKTAPLPTTPVITPSARSLVAGRGGYTASVGIQEGMTFQWSIAGGTLTSGTSSPQITFSAGPAGTLQLACKAINAAGTSSATATVSLPVLAGPEIQGFHLTPATIQPGQSSTLTWSTLHADTVVIDHGVGQVSASGSRPLSPTMTTTYTLTASNAITSVTATVTLFVAGGKVPAPHDLDGDGCSDLCWRNTANGAAYAQLINTTGVKGGADVLPLEPAGLWQIVALADCDGNGRADLLWWNSASGQVQRMLMNGAIPTGSEVIYTEPDTTWKIVGVGDFDGDGKVDLLWQQDGTRWLAVVQLPSVSAPTSLLGILESEDWQVAGVGDCDGDGKADVLLWNRVTGEVKPILANGTAPKPTSGNLIHQATDPAVWKLLLTADFNGDGTTDLLWRNLATGICWVQPLAPSDKGVGALAGTVLATEPDLAWQIVDAGDYDGNGRADLLWWHATTGQVRRSLMEDAPLALALKPSTILYAEPVTTWRIQPSWISPSFPTLAPLATQVFTATLSGTNHSAITWTTTGGTISPKGLYTAPATPGTYRVRATSLEGTGKAVEAVVTVR